MTDDIIDQVISEAETTAIEAPIEDNTEETTEAPTEEVTEDSTEEATEGKTEEAPATEDTPFPKKAVNALARRDKKISKMQAEHAANLSELHKFREQAQKAEIADAPKEDAFDNYGDYLKAVARHEMKQETSAESQKQQEAQFAEKEQAYVAERETYATEKALAAIAEVPEYKQLVIENADVLQSLPPHLERAFLEADEPAYAFLALAKEGALESLSDMSPARAAMEIGKAEVRGAAMAQKKEITKAPAPIAQVRGTGKVNKSINDNPSSDDVMKWLKS